MQSQIPEIVVIVLTNVILINLVQTTIHLEGITILVQTTTHPEEITNLVQTIIHPEEKVILAVQGIDKLPCPSGFCPIIHDISVAHVLYDLRVQ
tara:strand:- start:2034 stop:2315 length:282 start_codon:yes stop_codon:yes gene_type:complete